MFLGTWLIFGYISVCIFDSVYSFFEDLSIFGIVFFWGPTVRGPICHFWAPDSWAPIPCGIWVDYFVCFFMIYNCFGNLFWNVWVGVYCILNGAFRILGWFILWFGWSLWYCGHGNFYFEGYFTFRVSIWWFKWCSWYFGRW